MVRRGRELRVRLEVGQERERHLLAHVGDQTLDLMSPAADSLVTNLPHAVRGTVAASDHAWEPKAMALTIAEFLVDRAGRSEASDRLE